MSVHVMFRSGRTQHFVVPKIITAVDFRDLAAGIDPSGIKTFVIVTEA